MARFRATIQGAQGEASRLGNASSGLRVDANGWDAGVRIAGFVDANGVDCFGVYMTGGSHGGRETLLGIVKDAKDRPDYGGPRFIAEM
jgi:hypothetical protein